jgi:hypothetical protein
MPASAGRLGTLCLGVAFLFIALVRAVGGSGVGWQALIGGLLALVGAVNLIQPEIGGLIVPIALVVAGAVLVFGGLLGPDRRRGAALDRSGLGGCAPLIACTGRRR